MATQIGPVFAAAFVVIKYPDAIRVELAIDVDDTGLGCSLIHQAAELLSAGCGGVARHRIGVSRRASCSFRLAAHIIQSAHAVNGR